MRKKVGLLPLTISSSSKIITLQNLIFIWIFTLLKHIYSKISGFDVTKTWMHVSALWTNTILISSSPLSILLLHKNMLIQAVENELICPTNDLWRNIKVTIRFQHRCYLLQSSLAYILVWLKYKCFLDTMLEWYKFPNDEKILYVKPLHKFINKNICWDNTLFVLCCLVFVYVMIITHTNVQISWKTINYYYFNGVTKI